jgi:hypothetical protein
LRKGKKARRGEGLGPAEEVTAVSYARASDAELTFWRELDGLLDGGAKRVCDIGGGAKPAMSLKRIHELEIDYLVLDESQAQLDRAPAGYEGRALDILDARAVAELVRERGPFDLVLSRWTAEHMRDGRRFHENVRIMLRPRGTALHYFPTLYALPFLANRMMPEDLSASLLFGLFRKRKVKFPARYSWCRGPTRGQLTGLHDCGYSVDRYYGFFGHGFYARVSPLQAVERLFAKVLVKHPVPLATSFAVVVLTLEM